jgi:hypothetical protein
VLIGLLIAILYFLARKITAEGAEERRVFNRLSALCASLRTLRLNFLFGYSMSHVRGSSCIVKSLDSGFGYLSSYKLLMIIIGGGASPICSGPSEATSGVVDVSPS